MNKKLLIVEDEFIVANDLQLILEHAGYHVCGIAASVAEAREMVAAHKPGLVLLDIYLKGNGNGIELAKTLREDNIAFVYLSANSNQSILEAASATEPYGFLVKPFREKDLLVALDIAFYRHENSLESGWRRELKLQKELSGIQAGNGNRQQKGAGTARALQPYLPFDALALRFKSAGSAGFSAFAFLRVGFDEYQYIGPEELPVITGMRPAEISALLTGTPADTAAGYYNGDDFTNMLPGHHANAMFARTFGFRSVMVLPLLAADGGSLSVHFFRRQAAGYGNEQLNLLSRLQLQLTAIMNSMTASDVSPSLSHILGTAKAPVVKAGLQFEGLTGNSAALLHVLDMITLVAPLDTSVLLLGESGTGKERVADCIHRLSPRNHQPFIKVNCAALPPALIESELFGHEKGSFTGALEKRTGKFELASNGTIFLDEIGDMPPALQVKLLRVLQEREVERIGGHRTIKVDVRVITATNRNLEHEMAEGRFRLDLYYRLNVFPVRLPPLRERREDIRQLAYFFAQQFSTRYNRNFTAISEPMVSELEAYHWPGNIRELENVMEQSMILNEGNPVLTLRQPLSAGTIMAPQAAATPAEYGAIKTIDEIKRLQRQVEKDHISSVLTKTGGRIRGKNGAAELLNEKPTTLESRMAKLGIKKEDFL